MKVVKESLFEFHKGNDPLDSLGLGPYTEWVHFIFDKCEVPRKNYRIEENKRTIFGHYLNLAGCHILEKLPNNLYVCGDLDLGYCINLEELPSGLIVDGDLNLYRCNKLSELPRDLKVEDYIFVNWDNDKLIQFIKKNKIFKNKLEIQ
jgi:hypothetical protein